jgi:hypothetical protein
MPEQLGLDQRLRNGAARNRHKRTPGALAQVVDRGRHQFLTGPALALNQNEVIQIRHAPDQVVHHPHSPARSDQPVAARELPQLRLCRVQFLPEQRVLVRPPDHQLELQDVWRLPEVVVNPVPHERHRRRRPVIVRHRHDRCAEPPDLRDPRQSPFHALPLRIHVEDEHVHLLVCERCPHPLPVGFHLHAVSFAQRESQHALQAPVVGLDE